MKYRRFSAIFLSLLVFGATHSLYAQRITVSEKDAVPLKRGTFGRIQFGPSFLNLDQLNPVLEGKEFLPITENYFAVGIGISQISGKWITGIDSYNYMIAESNLDNQLAVLGFHYATVNAGYLFFRKGNEFFVYPLFGIGGGLTNLKSKPYDQQFPVTFRAVGWLGDVSLNFRKVGLLADGKGSRVELGFQAGYLYVSPKSGFNLKKFEPDSAVNVNPGGPYFRFSIGIGKMH
ncbi:MAG: hypothetical protein R3C61_06900 [Bacteroidia bacterium]